MLTDFNEKTVREVYRFLNHEKETEIRLIDPKGKEPPKSFFVYSENEFVEICKQFNGKYNIYVGINERRHQGRGAEDVLSVKTIVVDIDAVRPDSKQPSTKEELEKADKVASQISYDFTNNGSITPVKAMSGNGYQLWFAIPKIEITDKNRDEISEKLKAFQRMVIEKYSDNKNATIDNIGDLPRIIKVIGTKSIKGDNTPERPHRLSFVCTPFGRKEDDKMKKVVLSIKLDKKVETDKGDNWLNDKEIKNIIDRDNRIKNIFRGKWEGYGYKSRSEAELAVVIRLVSHRVSKNQIFEIMDKSKLGKWSEKSESYKNMTYQKAVEYCDKNNFYVPEALPSKVISKIIDYINFLPPCIRGILKAYTSSKSVIRESITDFEKNVLFSFLNKYFETKFDNITDVNVTCDDMTTANLCKRDKICSFLRLGNSDHMPSEYFEYTSKSYIWDKINVQSFNIYVGSKAYYEMVIDGHKIQLDEDEISSPNKFRVRYLNTFGVMPSIVSATEWAQFLTILKEKYGGIHRKVDVSEEHEAVNVVLSYIRSSNMSVNPKDALRHGIVYYDGIENKIYVPSEIIRYVLHANNMKISLQKLAYQLSEYTTGKTKQVKVSGEPRRFWVFDASKFDIENKKKNLIDFSKDEITKKGKDKGEET